MRTMKYADGEIILYDDDMGAPGLLVNHKRYYIPLVLARNKRASKIRVRTGEGEYYALARDLRVNFAKIVVAPEVAENGDIVFKRYNGETAYRLKVI